MQRRLIQTKAYYKLFYSVWKETSHKPLKVAVTIKYFRSVYIIDTTCFDEYFLFHVITRGHYFYTKFIVTQRFGATVMLLHCLKRVFWKESAFYVWYIHNNITMLLIPKAQNKALNVLNKIFFADSIFSLFQFVNNSHFSLQMESLKLKSS